ncbi:hypothetical protein GIB67_029863 [Kingdonia uniflora]|uniref:SWI/SNF-related matrix-associated actin-dependent regulator of chromatin subfamily A-like protein 1 n=1 Tax=Kingdonia uniflora TaxID=39325 RepID=A0A7J7NJ66_9MAGN|nr:hypothetical protein GIB67_029863 [Kingdonia uniflora]
MFPMSSLQVAEKVLSEISGANVEVEKLDSLVRRAIVAASAVPDLRDLYNGMPSVIESKLMPFQRDGVRFMLQHGGRVLLADEMGLGKTLQAIAVTSCIRESWPVLVLAPSSLRLHWASMIHQWLNIPPSDILVVLSQLSGSNRGGFKIIQSNAKEAIHLDGLFNIISYDMVSKLHNTLMASEFKVEEENFQYEIMRSKNYCIKRLQNGVWMYLLGEETEEGYGYGCGMSRRIKHSGRLEVMAGDKAASFCGMHKVFQTSPSSFTLTFSDCDGIIIADESHFLKNAQAKRTSSSIPVLQKAQYVILLSGTPALSRPIELFKQLEALYPAVYNNIHYYGNRYCKGGIFGAYQGASNHEELHNLMKATLMIRRLKKEVLSELPVKRRQQVFLDLAEKDMKPINALFRELEVVKNRIKDCKSQEEVESLKFTQKNIINKIYNESAEAKIPAVQDYLGTVIEVLKMAEESISLRCESFMIGRLQVSNICTPSGHDQFDTPISSCKSTWTKKVSCIRIDGGTPASSRQSLVTDFQERDDIRAAVLSIKAGGVGLTLTAASTVIFAELSWTPGDIIQAEDRAHRIGQLSSVNIYYLLANDTVDDIIWDVVQSKLENLGQMLDGHDTTLQVSLNQPHASPAKQKTLYSFLKRCHSSTDGKLNDSSDLQHPRVKYPKN